jgi:hypothetical protein
MKRIFLFAYLTLIIQIGLIAQGAITLRIDKINVKTLNPGDKVLVGVFCDNQTGGLGGFQLYIDFDRSVLEFKNSINKHPFFNIEWIENFSNCCYASNWLTLEKGGVNFKPGEKLFDLEFVYKGGETTLIWQKEQIIKEDRIVQGQTMFIDGQAMEKELKLIDGCVCKTE